MPSSPRPSRLAAHKSGAALREQPAPGQRHTSSAALTGVRLSASTVPSSYDEGSEAMQHNDKRAERSAEAQEAVSSWLRATADMIQQVSRSSEWHVAAMQAAKWQKALIEQEVSHVS